MTLYRDRSPTGTEAASGPGWKPFGGVGFFGTGRTPPSFFPLATTRSFVSPSRLTSLSGGFVSFSGPPSVTTCSPLEDFSPSGRGHNDQPTQDMTPTTRATASQTTG